MVRILMCLRINVFSVSRRYLDREDLHDYSWNLSEPL